MVAKHQNTRPFCKSTVLLYKPATKTGNGGSAIHSTLSNSAAPARAEKHLSNLNSAAASSKQQTQLQQGNKFIIPAMSSVLKRIAFHPNIDFAVDYQKICRRLKTVVSA